MSDDVIKFPERNEVLMEVGGLVDQSSVTLCIYGDDVDPESISKMLRCEPTSSHKKGDPRNSRVRPLPPWPSGAWLLEVRGKVPEGPEELTRNLLMRLPKERAIWDQLSEQYDVRVSYGIHMDAWNRGFELAAATVKQVAALGATVEFDIYADGDDV